VPGIAIELAVLLANYHSLLIRLASHTEQKAKENNELALLINKHEDQVYSSELGF